MEEIQNQLEILIDDIERDETMTRSDLISALYKLKEQIEEILEEANAYNLRNEVKEEAEKIFKENDMFSRIDAYVNAYYKIIDDLD